MSIFSTDDAKVLLPRNIADGMVEEARTESTVAKLAGREPQRFGETEYIIFNDFPKAEFVEEGGEKASSRMGYDSVKSRPYKAQVTLRFNEEVQWASEDYQLSIFQDVARSGQTALSRALDLGMYHRINPLTGEEITAWTNYVGATDNRVEYDGTVDADRVIRNAVGSLIQQDVAWPVNGIALDPAYAWELASLEQPLPNGDPSGTPRYPNLGFGTDISSFAGLPTAQGNTVSGRPEAEDTGIRAIVGDFNSGIRWGVQRDLPLDIIRFGDPDGQGDLKRQNQIALRLEIVYGWYVFADRFAVIEAADEEGEG